MHDYYFGVQSEQYAFFRVPTLLFTDEQYKNISCEAKVLYGILLSRMELSAKNGWIDDQGRVYIICTTEEIMEKLNCGNQKAVKLMAELEKGCELIERKRQGLGKPNLIYVKNFLPTENIPAGKIPVGNISVENIHAGNIRAVENKAVNASPSHFLKCENHTSGDVKITAPEMCKSHASNIDKKYIDQRYIDNPIYQGSGRDRMDGKDGADGAERMDGMEEYEQYKNRFRTELELDTLIQRYPDKEETLEGILELLAETCSTKKEEICIAGDHKPRELVKNRLMKLNATHIQYVLECMKENTSDIKNIKQYLLTMLFNAPVTISSYYQAKVNHDLYGYDNSE